MFPRLPPPPRGLLFLTALVFAGGAGAAPYRPSSDAEVLEHLPPGALSAADRPSAPQDLGTAVALARAYIERSRRDGDPRFLGYAEGVLLPWWKSAAPPPPVLLLRATLLQARHQFDDALRDLDRLLAASPQDAQALLTRATILRVQGRYIEAEASCAQLSGRASAFVTDLCIASVRSLAGQLPAMATALDEMEIDSHSEPPSVRVWYSAERADMAERLGQDTLALKYYREALAEDGGGDPLLRAATADLLLRHNRCNEALEVTGAEPVADVLRLRAAIASRRMGQPRKDLEAALADSYAASRRRSEDMHLREEARFALEVLNDVPRALELASQNWTVQREPADVFMVLDAASRANRPDAAIPVRQWMAESHLQDARLRW